MAIDGYLAVLIPLNANVQSLPSFFRITCYA